MKAIKRLHYYQERIFIKPDHRRFEMVIQAALNAFSISEASLKKKIRKRDYVLRRYAVFYLLAEEKITGTTAIGKRFNCDHSTVSHGIKEAKNLIDTNYEPFVTLLNQLKQCYTTTINDNKMICTQYVIQTVIPN